MIVPVVLFELQLWINIFPQYCVASVSRSHEYASSSDDYSVNVEEGNILKREVVSKLRALSESEPSISARKTKALNGYFLVLAPPAIDFPYLEVVNQCVLINTVPQCLQLFDCAPSWVTGAERTPPSGLGISVQQPTIRLFPSA